MDTDNVVYTHANQMVTDGDQTKTLFMYILRASSNADI